MSRSKDKDESYDVSDSTDWLQTPLPSLAPVDSALRCQVCRDFYNTPMITSCSHTFCSLCIRHCLNNDAKCPACRKGDQESKLRNNYALEELVEAFKSARPLVLLLAKKSQEVDKSSSQKRKRTEDKTEENGSPVRKRTRAGTRAQQSSQQAVIQDSEDDDDYEPETPKQTQFECPICGDGFPTERAVEAHLDQCNGEPASKKPRARSTQTSLPPQPVSKANTKRPERLAALNYSMVKDNALRKKMMDLGISASGSRPLMERRYTEWLTLWNANCDSKTPKATRELKRELDIWDRTQGGGAPMASRTNPGGNIRDKDFDGLAWSRNNDDAFKDLVSLARMKRVVRTEEPANPEAPSDSTSSAKKSSVSPLQPVPSVHRPTKENMSSAKRDESSLDIMNVPKEVNGDAKSLSPPKLSTQRRFVEDGPSTFESSSIQQVHAQVLDRDKGVTLGTATLRPLPP